MENKTGSTNTGRDSKSMWNPSPTTYLTAIISETWGKTDDPLTISWQRPSSWFKTVAICPSSMMNYCEMLLTSCERNVLLKEMTSHSRNPEKLLAPWQSYQATAPRNYKRSRYNTSQLTTQSQRQHQRPERQQSPLVWNYLVEAHGEKKPLDQTDHSIFLLDFPIVKPW